MKKKFNEDLSKGIDSILDGLANVGSALIRGAMSVASSELKNKLITSEDEDDSESKGDDTPRIAK